MNIIAENRLRAYVVPGMMQSVNTLIALNEEIDDLDDVKSDSKMIAAFRHQVEETILAVENKLTSYMAEFNKLTNELSNEY
jgi:hypothetical protein